MCIRDRDSKAVAERVGKVLGVDEVHAELLPENKVEEVERLLAAKSKKGKLLFVGDGINDAPVLARADVGVAMGGLGSDAAIEAADAVSYTHLDVYKRQTLSDAIVFGVLIVVLLVKPTGLLGKAMREKV